ncbi:hypothetical protein [Lichenibacterium dinghuense]|uniref:hypothetical protein n=1 Tax=Lichenibacterium dinghuense TaxID=2895977 RepID=UPI001F157E09|nr:hypothetical protein [Lichenibacterium sp. 6Y81]
MRRTALFLAAIAGLSAPTAARACDPVVTECLPAVVVFPAYTHEGIRVGTVEARVAQPLALERSRYTGQPRTVVFNDPGSMPGAVDPGLTLVPLPRVKRYATQAAYPAGY